MMHEDIMNSLRQTLAKKLAPGREAYVHTDICIYANYHCMKVVKYFYKGDYSFLSIHQFVVSVLITLNRPFSLDGRYETISE